MKKTNTKPTKTTMSAGSRRIFENDIFGDEPTFPPNKELTQLELVKAYGWYNYVKDRNDAIAFIKKYFQSRNPQIASKIDGTNGQHLLTSFCWAARMIDNGVLLPPDLSERITKHVTAVIERYSTKKDLPCNSDKNREKSDNIIADIEEMLDKGGTFSVYEYLGETNTPKVHVQKIINFYEPILAEIKSAKSTKDAQLKEAYRHLKAKELLSLIATFQDILDDCNKFLENKKITRKPRKKKTVSLAKKTANVQYLEKFDPFQIVSKTPESVIGAKEVWLYNAKYKTITKLVAEDGGFDIKGTTIININMAESVKKTTGRQSQAVVNDVINGGKIQMRKMMDKIKGVTSEASGRINKDVLIIRTN